MKKETILTIAFVVFIAFIKFFFHEFWKDEWQAWLVARDMSLFNMIGFLNYEGHPSLWYLYLKPFTWLSAYVDESFLLNFAHLIPIIFCTYLLFLKTSLPLFFKILIALSYFYCFEYGVINRGYILVCAISLLSVLALLENKMLTFSLALFLLCQTEIYGVLIGFALLYHFYVNNGFKNLNPYLYFAVGLLVFVITVYPRGNSEDFTRAYNQAIISSTNIYNCIQGLLANTFAIGFIPDTAAYGYSTLGLLFSFFVFSTIVYIFHSIKLAWQTWLIGFILLLLFSISVFVGGVRQWGFVYLLFTLVLILNPSVYKTRLNYWLIVLLLSPPVIHNVKALFKEIKINFSNAKDAGAFIKNKIPENVAIVSLNKFETAGAAAYAHRKMFEMPSGKAFTYFRWLEKIYVPTQSELMLFARFKGAKGLIVLSPKPIDEKRFPILKLWKKFDKENFKSEAFYFYTLDLSGRN